MNRLSISSYIKGNTTKPTWQLVKATPISENEKGIIGLVLRKTSMNICGVKRINRLLSRTYTNRNRRTSRM